MSGRSSAGYFTSAEERKDNDHVAVLADKYFERRFHRDPAALGKSIALGGTSYTVIGVLPPRFYLPATWEGMDQQKPDVWVPLSRLWNTAADDSIRQLLDRAAQTQFIARPGADRNGWNREASLTERQEPG